MTAARRRTALRTARARLIYRLDAFLAWPPAVQVGVILLLTALVVFGWAVAGRLAMPGDPRFTDRSSAVWWSLMHFFDGGALGNALTKDHLTYRLLALGATSSGVLVLSLLTAAFASKMGERIGDLRSGTNAVVERGHLLVLGFDPKIVLVAREIARSRQACTLVILTEDDKNRVEAALRPVRLTPGLRLKVVVRTGDPRSEDALQRVSATRARAVLVVPPAALGDEASVDWTLSTLLAVRRAVDEDFRGQVIVEARRAEAEALFALVGEAHVAGAGRLAVQVVVSEDRIARVLAQSVRQEGIYFALRQMLAFNQCEVLLDRVPAALVGVGFAEAHAAIEGAVLFGLRRPDGTLDLVPPAETPRRLTADNRLVLLGRAAGEYHLRGALPPAPEPAGMDTRACHAPETISLLGYNRTLPHLARELHGTLPAGSRLRVVCALQSPEAEEILRRLPEALPGIPVERDAREPARVAREGDPALYASDGVIILGRDDGTEDHCDANALAILLWLRGRMRTQPGAIRRVVTEVRDPRSAAHVAEKAHDFVVSHAVSAMLLAQEALDPGVALVYREILSPRGVEIFLRPRKLYLPAGPATFADVMVAARARGEVALGFYVSPGWLTRAGATTERADHDAEPSESEGANPMWLNPARDELVDDRPEVLVVVLAHP